MNDNLSDDTNILQDKNFQIQISICIICSNAGWLVDWLVGDHFVVPNIYIYKLMHIYPWKCNN
jgi:hypothetical protein